MMAQRDRAAGAAPADEPGPAADERIATLADSLDDLMRTFSRTRAHLLDRARHDGEW